jgi:hypothetical protein
MRLAPERSRIPRIPSWKKQSKNKPKEDQSSKELANTNIRQEHLVFP